MRGRGGRVATLRAGVLAVSACLLCCLVPPALLAGAATGAGVAGLAVLGGLLTATPWLVAAGAAVAVAVLLGPAYTVARRRRALPAG
jgi:hypothetical protein